MLRAARFTVTKTSSTFRVPVVGRRAYAGGGGGGHGHDDHHGHDHHAPPLYKPRDEWDAPQDARYWHDMLKNVKAFNKDFAAEEHHSSFYLRPNQMAKPGVYDETQASAAVQRKRQQSKTSSK